MVLLEGIVIYILIMSVVVAIAPPIILNIIWIKRVKCGKSRIIGPLGIITGIFTLVGLLSLPRLFTMIGEYFGWIE